jgi:WXG100 family type VII secretion target
MKASVMKALLRIARSVLQSVIGEIAKQMNVVQELSDSITSQFIPMLESWQGDDADAFRAEIRREVVPLLAQLVGAILGIQTGVERAVERVESTDKNCVSHVDNLANQFRAII